MKARAAIIGLAAFAVASSGASPARALPIENGKQADFQIAAGSD